jgi:endonuclease III
MWYKQKKMLNFFEEIWNDLHLQMIWYGREYSPARGWDLENDTITKTVGRKTILNKYYKKNFTTRNQTSEIYLFKTAIANE